MTHLFPRPWVPAACEAHVQALATTATQPSAQVADRIEALIQANLQIHDQDCFNLNPATNVMNPRAEAALSRGLGSRPSLGYPGDKYEMGLEAIEEIEVITAELAAEIFQAKYAEIRVGSGALANLYGFMALAKPGDSIIAPPGSIGGHVTHHAAGCAGLYGLTTHPAPIDADGYTLDLAALHDLAHAVRPKIITVGGSLNLFPHPVAEVRKIADQVGAKVLFDAAHQCGIIAGKVWSNPLLEGAHLMTMSTYKSLGGPAGGLIVTNDAAIAERLDAIAFPGLTANFDAAKSAALALTLLDWRDHGPAYAKAMVDLARALAPSLPSLACRSSPPTGGPPPRTSSPSRRQPSAAVRQPPRPCGRPVS
jgi:glycine hydroxymethyltransferase